MAQILDIGTFRLTRQKYAPAGSRREAGGRGVIRSATLAAKPAATGG